MKSDMNRMVQWTAGALIAAAIGTTSAYAQQPGDSGVAASAPATSAAQSRRAIHKADRLLAKQVRRALVRVKGLDSSRIVVIARSGDVTLGGSVPEAGQTGLALAAARGVSGVSNVSSSLGVKAAGQ